MVNGFVLFIKLFWRTALSTLLPIVLVVLYEIFDEVQYEKEIRCLNVYLLMMGLWVLDAIPRGAIGFLPVVFYPLMGIMPAERCCKDFILSANVLFIASVVAVSSVEQSGLTKRIFYKMMLCFGQDLRSLHMGFTFMTMITSMWYYNSGTVTLLMPMLEDLLKDMEGNGLVVLYTYPDNYQALPPEEQEKVKKPSNITCAFYLTLAYVATIGGYGTVIGAASNIALRNTYEKFYTEDLSFLDFFIFNIGQMIIGTVAAFVFIEFFFMGLLRPKSVEGQATQKTKDAAETTRTGIKGKLSELGPITFHELMSLLVLILMGGLLFTRYTELHHLGWRNISPRPFAFKDSCAACFAVILAFMIPAKPRCYLVCSDDDSVRPQKPSPSLLNWKMSESRVPWDLVMAMGGGSALIEGMRVSGLSTAIGWWLFERVRDMPLGIVQLMAMGFATVVTEICDNVVVVILLLPILAELSFMLKWHPAILMVVAGMALSHSFMLPCATLPNEMVYKACNVPIYKMMTIGFMLKIVMFAVLFLFWEAIGEFLWEGEGIWFPTRPNK